MHDLYAELLAESQARAGFDAKVPILSEVAALDS